MESYDMVLWAWRQRFPVFFSSFLSDPMGLFPVNLNRSQVDTATCCFPCVQLGLAFCHVWSQYSNSDTIEVMVLKFMSCIHLSLWPVLWNQNPNSLRALDLPGRPLLCWLLLPGSLFLWWLKCAITFKDSLIDGKITLDSRIKYIAAVSLKVVEGSLQNELTGHLGGKLSPHTPRTLLDHEFPTLLQVGMRFL